MSEEQRAFYGLCASYKDVYFPLRPYPTRCAPATTPPGGMLQGVPRPCWTLLTRLWESVTCQGDGLQASAVLCL